MLKTSLEALAEFLHVENCITNKMNQPNHLQKEIESRCFMHAAARHESCDTKTQGVTAVPGISGEKVEQSVSEQREQQKAALQLPDRTLKKGCPHCVLLSRNTSLPFKKKQPNFNVHIMHPNFTLNVP